MIVFGLLGCITAVSLFCWLLFTLAVYAFPFFVGLTVTLWALRAAIDPFGATVAGFLAAVLAYGIFRACLAARLPQWLRIGVSTVLVLPSGMAGFSVASGFAELVVPPGAWQVAFALFGALFVGATALARIGAIRPSEGSTRRWRLA